MTSFKRMGITAAVAAASASFVGLSNAQTAAVSSDGLGDLAIVPYYTVLDGLRTGVHIINTTEKTQVVKFRMRRGSDSADALDFNIIMSPRDEWVASINLDGEDIKVTTTDTTCTAPAAIDNSFTMPSTFREGAEEGYIEIIGMGQPLSELFPLPAGAKHKAGVPASCETVRRNFFRVPAAQFGDVTVRGTHNANLTATGQPLTTGALACTKGKELTTACGLTAYEDTDDRALKVSYFTRDSQGGLEFGNNAVHVEGFSGSPMMTNQQKLIIQDGVLQFDPLNFELPNLDGGPFDYNATLATFADTGLDPLGVDTSGPRFGKYNPLRSEDVLGRDNVINDWSARATADFSVSTDWVVTLPGQYLMTNWASLAFDGGKSCTAAKNCDLNDLPVSLGITFWDREEASFQEEEGDLSVSPGGAPGETQTLENEVNVIEWSKGQPNVLGSNYAKTFTPGIDADAGWAKLSVDSNPFATTPPAIFYPDPNSAVPATGAVPIVGFAVWERNFGANAAANYGRAIDHSYGSSGI